MEESDPAPIAPIERQFGAVCLRGVIPLMLSLLVAWSCYAVGGVSLGLFFGPILLVTFLAPPLTMGDETTMPRVLTGTALTLGIALVWLIAGNLSLFDAMRCVAMLAAYVFALAGFAVLLSRLRIGATYAAMLTVVIAFAWLTWPVWLSPWLYGLHAEAIAHCLAVAHPLMAINAVLVERFNSWDRYTLSYQQLTTLNQDVFYTLPKSVAWMILVHAGIGITGLWRPRKMKTAPGFAAIK